MSGGQGVAVIDRVRLAEDRVRPEVSQWADSHEAAAKESTYA